MQSLRNKSLGMGSHAQNVGRAALVWPPWGTELPDLSCPSDFLVYEKALFFFFFLSDGSQFPGYTSEAYALSLSHIPHHQPVIFFYFRPLPLVLRLTPGFALRYHFWRDMATI